MLSYAPANQAVGRVALTTCIAAIPRLPLASRRWFTGPGLRCTSARTRGPERVTLAGLCPASTALRNGRRARFRPAVSRSSGDGSAIELLSTELVGPGGAAPPSRRVKAGRSAVELRAIELVREEGLGPPTSPIGAERSGPPELLACKAFGWRGVTRTLGLPFRRRALCPPELLATVWLPWEDLNPRPRRS